MGRSQSPSEALKALAADTADPGAGITVRDGDGPFRVPVRALAASWEQADRHGDTGRAVEARKALAVLGGLGSLQPQEAYDLAVMLTNEMQAVWSLTAENVRLRNEAAESGAVRAGTIRKDHWRDLKLAMDSIDRLTAELEDPRGLGRWPVCDGMESWAARYRRSMAAQSVVLGRINLHHRQQSGPAAMPRSRRVIDAEEVSA